MRTNPEIYLFTICIPILGNELLRSTARGVWIAQLAEVVCYALAEARGTLGM